MRTRLRLPPGPKGLPLIGSGRSMGRDPLAFVQRVGLQYGDLSCARFGSMLMYSVNHPDLVEALFVGKHRECIKDRTTRDLIPLLGNGLLTSEGEHWRRQRKLASPPLQPKRIEQYAQTMLEGAQRMAAGFRQDEVRDIHADFMQLTLEIVGKTLLGFDTRRDAEAVGKALESVVAYFERLMFTPMRLLPFASLTPSSARFRRAKRDLDRIVDRMIARARKAGGEADHLLARLLRAQTEDGQSMTDAQAHDEAMTMLLAGHETTALALTYAVYLLSKHPQCEVRLREELKTLGGAAPTAADLGRLPYLDAVVKETLRLYPPAWAFGREAIAPFELGGYPIPVGAQLVCSPYALHRDPRFFSDPLRFAPERWLNADGSQPPRYAYVPFGVGPRICIGNHFAKLEAALVLAALLQRVRLRVVPGYRLQLKPVVTMRPAHGLPVLVEHLDAAQPRAAQRPTASEHAPLGA